MASGEILHRPHAVLSSVFRSQGIRYAVIDEAVYATEEPSKCKDRSGKESVDAVDPNKLCASEGGPGGWQFQQREM